MGLGLGYNEDLMSRLAIESSGNHTFIEDSENLVEVFQREFDDVLSVVAQNIEIKAKLADGVRPVKVLNYPADIDGQTVSIELGQLYAQQERYFVIELEVEQGKAGSSRRIAEVSVRYKNTITDTVDKLTSTVDGKFTHSKSEAEAAINKGVLASCVIQIANERNQEATVYRDRGDVSGAEKLLKENALYLEENYRRLGDEELKRRSDLNATQAGSLSGADWARSRKAMREAQAADTQQQSYSGSGAKIGKP
jgi:Ca-activated chloride channel family protein